MLAAPHSGVLAITKYPASGSAVFGRTYVTYVPASRYRIASARARLMQPSRAPNSDRDEQAFALLPHSFLRRRTASVSSRTLCDVFAWMMLVTATTCCA